MPSKKKSAKAESKATAKPVVKKKKSAAPQSEDTPVKRPRAPRKTKATESEAIPAPSIKGATVDATGGEEEAAAHAADTFEEAFEDRGPEHAHAIDPEKVAAAVKPKAARGKKKPAA